MVFQRAILYSLRGKDLTELYKRLRKEGHQPTFNVKFNFLGGRTYLRVSGHDVSVIFTKHRADILCYGEMVKRGMDTKLCEFVGSEYRSIPPLQFVQNVLLKQRIS